MRRMVWVAIGAAGGILAYRRLVELSEQAREQGLVLTAQQAGLSAAQALGTARALASTSVAQAKALQAAQQPAGQAAANVLRRQGEGE